jgi:hypothetical protein
MGDVLRVYRWKPTRVRRSGMNSPGRVATQPAPRVEWRHSSCIRIRTPIPKSGCGKLAESVTINALRLGNASRRSSWAGLLPRSRTAKEPPSVGPVRRHAGTSWIVTARLGGFHLSPPPSSTSRSVRRKSAYHSTHRFGIPRDKLVLNAMVFTKHLREGVRGFITCSIRIWKRPQVKVGGRYRMKAKPDRFHLMGSGDEGAFLQVISGPVSGSGGLGERIYCF